MDTETGKAYLEAALRALWSGSREVMEVYAGDFQVDRKDDLSPITEADRRSHRAMQAILGGRYAPEAPVISEEGDIPPYEERRRWKRLWLVDPLDGTREFVARNGEFMLNAALIEEGRPVLGAVYAPVADLLYFGAEGLGAFRLENFSALARADDPPPGPGSIHRALAKASRLPLPAASRDPAGRIRVISSRSHRPPELQAFIERLKEGGEVGVSLQGGSLKMCRLAEGSADIYPRFGTTYEWDTAAGHALILQTGGRVRARGTDQELVYNKEDLRNPDFLAMGEGFKAGKMGFKA